MVVVDGDEYALVEVTNRRRAHICCGCDTRNAVFAVNSVGLCFYTMAVISFSLLLGDSKEYDDDQVQAVMDTISNAKIGLTISTFAVAMVCNITAIVGAVYFNKFGTGIGGIWFLFETIRSLFIGDFWGALVAACFSYPHWVFYHELKTGVMSREQYSNEKVCCDCCCSC